MALRIATSVAPKVALIRAIVWVVASSIFLDVCYMKVIDLQGAGANVSPWRYAQVGFWLFVLLFWLYQGWKSIKAFRDRRKVV
jgi:hypothetical protein